MTVPTTAGVADIVPGASSSHNGVRGGAGAATPVAPVPPRSWRPVGQSAANPASWELPVAWGGGKSNGPSCQARKDRKAKSPINAAATTSQRREFLSSRRQVDAGREVVARRCKG